MYLTVTEEHIRNGVRCSYSSCPVALAFRDKGFPKLFTGIQTTCIQIPNTSTLRSFEHSGKLREQIKAFDKDGKFKPGRYTIKELTPCTWS